MIEILCNTFCITYNTFLVCLLLRLLLFSTDTCSVNDTFFGLRITTKYILSGNIYLLIYTFGLQIYNAIYFKW